MNDAYFLPEDRPSVELAAVEASGSRDDRAGSSSSSRGPSRGPPRRRFGSATRAEIDAHWHGAPATDELYRGRLEVVAGGEPFSVGEQRGIVVRVENHGSHVWPQGGVGLAGRSPSRIAGSTTAVRPSSPTGSGRRLPATLRARCAPCSCRSTCSRRPSRVRTCSSSTCSTSTCAGSGASFGCRSTSVRRSASRSSGRTTRARDAAAAALAEVAPDVRPLLLTAVARRDERAPRLRGGARRARLRPGRAVGRACAGRPAHSAVPERCSGTPRCDASAAGRGSPRPTAPSTSRA